MVKKVSGNWVFLSDQFYTKTSILCLTDKCPPPNLIFRSKVCGAESQMGRGGGGGGRVKGEEVES